MRRGTEGIVSRTAAWGNLGEGNRARISAVRRDPWYRAVVAPRKRRTRYAGPRSGETPAEEHARLGRVGVHPDALPRGARVPNADFYAVDLSDDANYPVTAESVAEVYWGGGGAVAYPTYIPTEDVPSPHLVEEGEDSDVYSDFDWSEFRVGASFPPPKLRVLDDGRLYLADGNHRIKFWTQMCREQYDYIPAWVVDARPAKKGRR